MQTPAEGNGTQRRTAVQTTLTKTVTLMLWEKDWYWGKQKVDLVSETTMSKRSKLWPSCIYFSCSHWRIQGTGVPSVQFFKFHGIFGKKCLKQYVGTILDTILRTSVKILWMRNSSSYLVLSFYRWNWNPWAKLHFFCQFCQLINVYSDHFSETN